MTATVAGRLARLEATRARHEAPPALPDPVELLRRLVGDPDPWQERLLRSAAPRVLVNVARQLGKSTACGALAAHMAASRPGSLTLCLSRSQRQSGELFRKVKDALAVVGADSLDLATDNALSLETTAGSRVVSLPGTEGTVRGYSGTDLLLVDEASRVPDELYRAIRPMLAVSRGRLLALSTPYGRRGWWWEAWQAEDQDWERFEVPATACARIDAAFLAEERRALGSYYDQEFLCQFLDAEMALFTAAAIDKLFDTDAAPLFPLALPA
jgi:hypothetical protein